MADTVLFVDDEENVLNAIERLFLDKDLRVLKAASADDALAIMGKEEVAVVVSDNLMPGTKGVELLVETRRVSPDTVRVLMTGYADLSTVIDAINMGEVFRFVVKPWDNESMVKTVEDGVNHYKVVQSLKNADESALRSIGQAIELKDPYTRGHCDRVAEYALSVAEVLGLGRDAKRDIKYGSWLHDCGKIGVPESILNVNRKLNEEEFSVVKNHPVWGAEVARQARLSQTVIDIILHHHERYDGKGYPRGLQGTDIPIEARIISVADVLDAITSERPYSKALSMDEAIPIVRGLSGNALDPQLVDILLGLLNEGKAIGTGEAAHDK